LAKVDGLPPLSVPYNQRLLQLPVPVPFNWQILGQGSQWLEAGGVYGFFQGRRAESFLTQVFPLSGGAWVFNARMSGDASESGGWFRWQFSCAHSNRVLHSIDITRLTAAPTLYEFNFEHSSSGCDFVRVTLLGVPGTFPQPARIEVNEVKLLQISKDKG
jgi:hypothetical protein